MLISFILSVVFLFCICKLTTNLQSTVVTFEIHCNHCKFHCLDNHFTIHDMLFLLEWMDFFSYNWSESKVYQTSAPFVVLTHMAASV